MTTLPRAVLIFLAATLVGAGGCEKKVAEQKRATVRGKIMMDGKPLKIGTIAFDPGAGEPIVSMNILDGNYEGKAPIGKCKVTISSIQKISMKEKMKMDGPGYDQMVEVNVLPARYNTESAISRDVEAGENSFNFDVEGK